MVVAVVEEEEFAVPENVRHLVLTPTAEDHPPSRPPPEPMSKQALEALGAVASVFTVRLTLFLAVVGAFVLSVLVVLHPSMPALLALGIYCAILVPLCWLAQKRVS